MVEMDSTIPILPSATADVQISASAPISLNPKNDNAPGQDGVFGVGLTDYLDIDDRPVFILDLKSPSKGQPVYCNPSLCKLTVLETKIRKGSASVNVPRDPGHAVFLEWALSSQKDAGDRLYSGLRWVAKTIKGRWRIIFGDADAIHDVDPFHTRRQSEIPRLGRAQTTAVDKPTFESQLKALESSREELIRELPGLAAPSLFPQPNDAISLEPHVVSLDFTRPQPGVKFSPHVQFIIEFDWANTDLGQFLELKL